MKNINIKDVKQETQRFYWELRDRGISHTLAISCVVDFLLGWNWAAIAQNVASKDANEEKNEDLE